jgi:hypothetical protein
MLSTVSNAHRSFSFQNISKFQVAVTVDSLMKVLVQLDIKHMLSATMAVEINNSERIVRYAQRICKNCKLLLLRIQFGTILNRKCVPSNVELDLIRILNIAFSLIILPLNFNCQTKVIVCCYLNVSITLTAVTALIILTVTGVLSHFSAGMQVRCIVVMRNVEEKLEEREVVQRLLRNGIKVWRVVMEYINRFAVTIKH